jgi:uncharacterized protein YaeQ
MALTATMYSFAIELADMDRGVYDSLSFKAACQPSETEEYLVTRVLAYCLEYGEGISFSRGIAEPDEPTISIRDLTGALTAWIEVGAPDAARLHRASKAAPRVAVYTHRARTLLYALAGEKIHRAESLELYSIDADVLSTLVERLDRRNEFALSISDREMYISMGGASITGRIDRLTIPATK